MIYGGSFLEVSGLDEFKLETEWKEWRIKVGGEEKQILLCAGVMSSGDGQLQPVSVAGRLAFCFYCFYCVVGFFFVLFLVSVSGQTGASPSVSPSV